MSSCGFFHLTLRVEPSRWQPLSKQVGVAYAKVDDSLSIEIATLARNPARVRLVIALLFPTTEGMN